MMEFERKCLAIRAYNRTKNTYVYCVHDLLLDYLKRQLTSLEKQVMLPRMCFIKRSFERGTVEVFAIQLCRAAYGCYFSVLVLKLGAGTAVRRELIHPLFFFFCFYSVVVNSVFLDFRIASKKLLSQLVLITTSTCRGPVCLLFRKYPVP